MLHKRLWWLTEEGFRNKQREAREAVAEKKKRSARDVLLAALFLLAIVAVTAIHLARDLLTMKRQRKEK